MPHQKRNSNYIKNEKYNEEEINKIVERLMMQKSNRNSSDFICRNIAQSYPQSNHQVLKAPGTFVKLENNNIFSKEGRSLYPDNVTSIHCNVNGEIRDYGVNYEFLTSPIFPKIPILSKYNLQSSIALSKYCYNIVVTNIDPKFKNKTFYIDGHPVHVLIRLFDEKRNYEILNTINKKNYDKELMSEIDFISLSYGITFSKANFGKDYLEKSVNLFTSIEHINKNHQMDLFIALKEKIKNYYQDDINKKRELLTMITKAISNSTLNEIPQYEMMRKDIEEKTKIIENKDNIISNKDNIISNKDNLINKLKIKIKQIENENKQLKQAQTPKFT